MKILVYRPGQLGDSLVALPILNTLRKAYPNSEIHLLTDRQMGKSYVVADEIFRGTGIFNNFYSAMFGRTYYEKILSKISLFGLIGKLRRQRYEVLLNLSPGWKAIGKQKRDRLFFWLCGIRRQVVAQDYRDIRPPVIHPLPFMTHEADTLMRCLIALDITVPEPDASLMDLHLGEADWAEYQTWLNREGVEERRWIAIGAGSKMPSKRWDIEKYRELGARLISDFDVTPLLVGGQEDAEISEELIRNWGWGVHACGKLSIRASACCLSKCVCYVGNDTGSMHLAVAAGIPCVGLFSARDYPGKWYPYGTGNVVFRKAVECEGCMLVDCIEEKRKCLRMITVDEVYFACSDYLKVDQEWNQNRQAMEER